VLTATASFSSLFFQLQQHSRYHPSFSAYKTALMTKTTWIFPAFSLRFVDFAVQFCFRCKFSFHGKPFKSSWRWCDLPGPITVLLLCIATNEIASFSFWQQITSNGFFRVCRSGQRSAFEFWNKKSCSSLFLYCIKQILHYIIYKLVNYKHFAQKLTCPLTLYFTLITIWKTNIFRQIHL